ncbi:helix-turn-helix domain-containing protein [Pedobacter jeongneungensis]|uniref:helix-turn-helix domain-containing protein n=1 Tax=Pedobacter jeongneungensis TaxID=947309 RepID=UPI00046A9688|nr:helix-turn-helix domain-containing protein [Pedobacter jeongneungensis]
MNSNPKDQVFNVLQAAKYLSCSKNAIYKLIKEGKLTVIRPSPKKTIILKSFIDKMFEECRYIPENSR